MPIRTKLKLTLDESSNRLINGLNLLLTSKNSNTVL